jgi:hypothetical protein
MKQEKAADELSVINNLIQEHEGIKGNMKSISTLAEDWTGMEWGDLPNLDHEQLHALNNKLFNLKQTMTYLDEGLKRHWGYEDKVLPELIGNTLMKSIQIEHNEIIKQMNEINFALNKSSPQDFLTNRSYVKHLISYLCQLISEHESKENTILQLLKRQFI